MVRWLSQVLYLLGGVAVQCCDPGGGLVGGGDGLQGSGGAVGGGHPRCRDGGQQRPVGGGGLSGGPLPADDVGGCCGR